MFPRKVLNERGIQIEHPDKNQSKKDLKKNNRKASSVGVNQVFYTKPTSITRSAF